MLDQRKCSTHGGLLCSPYWSHKFRQRVMGYIEEINALLVPRHTEEAVVLDLFAGCGGLALGFEAAGYKTRSICAV